MADGLATAEIGLRLRRRHRASFDLGEVVGRAQQRGAQQAFSHRGAAGVERVEECGLGGFAGEERLYELEIAHADGVEFETGGRS